MDSQTDPLWNNSHILFLGVMTLKNITGTNTITFFNVYDIQTALLEIIFLGQPTALRNHHETWYQMSDRKEIVAITQLGFNNWISTYWPTNGRVGRIPLNWVEFVTQDKSWVELKTKWSHWLMNFNGRYQKSNDIPHSIFHGSVRGHPDFLYITALEDKRAPIWALIKWLPSYNTYDTQFFIIKAHNIFIAL